MSFNTGSWSGEKFAVSKNTELIQFAYKNIKAIKESDSYEKMISGIPYNGYSKEIIQERTIRHEIAIDYASIRLKDFANYQDFIKTRYEYLTKCLGGLKGENIHLEPPIFFDYGYNVVIGDNFFANFNLTLIDCSIIKIGKNVQMGPNCVICTATHPIDSSLRSQGYEIAWPVEIGDDVWLGANVQVLPGVNIGNNVVIGAGSVVTKDIPDNCVAAGIPCKILRYINK